MKQNKLNDIFLSKSKDGFAMVLALVVMTVMFVVVASLSSTRQMWGFFSTKQLDRANIDFPTRADSENWLRLTRETLFRNGALTAPVHLSAPPSYPDGPVDNDQGDCASTVLYLVQGTEEPFPGVISDAAGDPDYPTYGTNIVSFSVPFYFDLGANIPTAGRTGANDPLYDPYWGMLRYGGSYAVMFKREMPEGTREIRQGRFSATTTQLRAWMSIDGALTTFLRYRVMPMSAFTYYYTPTYTGVASVGLTTNIIVPSNVAYNYDGYNVSSIGMGRIYVDEMVDFQSASTNNAITLGFPLVATRGFRNMGPATLHIPDRYEGGTITTNLSSGNFSQHRYLLYKGMLVTSEDVPQKLITRFASSNAPFVSRSFSQGIMSRYFNGDIPTAVRVRLNTTTNTSTLESAGPQASLLLSTNAVGMWTVDHTNRLVTLRPSANYFTNFTLPPTSIFFEFYGANASSYKLQVNVPSLAALGVTDQQRRLSVITTNILVIPSTGFNSDNSGNGAMLVSPRIEINSPTSPVNIGGYVITEGSVTQAQSSVIRPFYQYALTNVPDPMHTITGGLAYFGTAPNIVGGALGARIIPSVGYLQGTVVPPAVPAVFDYRISAQDMQIYQIIAVPNP